MSKEAVPRDLHLDPYCGIDGTWKKASTNLMDLCIGGVQIEQSQNMKLLCTYQCKPRGGRGVRARGGYLTNFKIL